MYTHRQCQHAKSIVCKSILKNKNDLMIRALKNFNVLFLYRLKKSSIFVSTKTAEFLWTY